MSRQTEAEYRRMKVLMSWSTTQKAIYNKLGFMPGAGFKTPEEQEVYRQKLVEKLERAERGAS